MSDKPDKTGFSHAQIAMAGLGAVVVIVIIVIASALWNSMSG